MRNVKLIAYCGLACPDCPAFRAFANDDEALREEAAKEWSKLYNADIKPGDIACTGCTTADDEGVKFRHCFDCRIRSCCKTKGLENCAHCDDFPCDLIGGLLDAVPEAKENLEEIRNNRRESTGEF